MSRLAKYVAVLMFACVGAYSQDTLSISTFDLDSAAVRSLRFLDVTGLTVSAIPAGRYLVPGDSTLIHNWVVVQLAANLLLTHSRALYADSSGSLASTVLALYALKTDTSSTFTYIKSLIAGKLNTADSTTFLAYVKSLFSGYVAKSTIRVICTSGLIDSIKTSDTLQLGWVYPASAVIDTIIYCGARGNSLTARIYQVDSLYQTAGTITLIDTMTCTNQQNKRSAVVSGGTFTLTMGKLLRVVFPTIGVMPKSFYITILGHYL